MIDRLRALDNRIASAERLVVASAFAVMVTVVFIQVVMRYVFSKGLPWAEELARYLMVWAGFLGASIATKDRRNITIDILPKLLSGKPRIASVLNIVSLAIAAIFAGFIAYFGARFCMHPISMRQSAAMGIPMWIPRLAIPLTGLMMTLRFTAQAIGETLIFLGKMERRDTKVDMLRDLISQSKTSGESDD